jgi:hypothetical protein
LATQTIVAAGARSRSAATVSRPIVPRRSPPRLAGLGVGDRGGVQRAGQRLDDTASSSAGRRAPVQLARVRDEALAPAAAGVAAVAGLQAGRDVAVDRVAAQRGQAARALGAGGSIPRAAQPSAGWSTTRSPRAARR